MFEGFAQCEFAIAANDFMHGGVCSLVRSYAVNSTTRPWSGLF